MIPDWLHPSSVASSSAGNPKGAGWIKLSPRLFAIEILQLKITVLQRQ
jgi:hypothetical protein